MKNIHFPFAVLVALVLPLAALGATETVDGIEWVYSTYEDEGQLVASVNGPAEEFYVLFYDTVVIPSTMGEYAVRSIGNSAFANSPIRSVIIPTGVKNIGDSAFRECNQMTSVTIPEGVTNIGNSAFFNCCNLTSLTIPEGVQCIGSSAFANCNELGSVIIPNGVKNVGDSAFASCDSLGSVTIS